MPPARIDRDNFWTPAAARRMFRRFSDGPPTEKSYRDSAGHKADDGGGGVTLIWEQ